MASLANGISIPSSYSAYLAPLSSSKLYNEVRAGKDDKGWETPYVVMFHAVNILSSQGGGDGGRCGAQVQECWEFEHPRRDVVLDNRGGSPEFHAGPVVPGVLTCPPRVTGHQQPQRPLRNAHIPYSACWRSPWVSWLL
jgi:hypothetical protein